MAQVKREYKDTMFRMVFKDKENLLELYNAVNQTHYTDVDALQITTLENAVYMNMKNDISFMFHFQLYLYEHQSSVNPNMPLRDLFYVSKSLQDMTKDVDLYSSTLKKIPTPRFVVFYNGAQQKPEKEVLCLSDSFKQATEQPELELKVTVLNINQGNNQKIMDACKTLKDYAAFVQMVRTYSDSLPLEEAIEKTIEECIQNDILADFLKKNRAEAVEVCLYEYNEELHLKEERDVAMEKGIEYGKKIGEEIGQKRGEEIGQKRGEEIGQKRGEEIGQKRGEQKISSLYRLLAENDRMQDILKATKNPEYQEKLLEEFGLK